MLKKISRLFVIKTRWEAFLIIYALALGAMRARLALPAAVPRLRRQAAVPRLHRRGVHGRREDPRLPEARAGGEERTPPLTT